MKNVIVALLLLFVALSTPGCKDDPDLPFPETEEFPQIFTNLTPQSTFSAAAVQSSAGNPTASFNIELQGGDLNQVEAIELFSTFRGFNSAGTAGTLSNAPRILVKSLPPTSGSVEVSINELITGVTRANATAGGARVPVTRASLRATESFTFTYELVLKDGRRIVYSPTFNTAPFAGTIAIAQ
ncbi:hypothetical protein [Solirubrum puertoriconensis]|uniref:CHRD domain-containing protein n=1 Tax=Solirubrum puertoriconensis TaxID=1751427 RepID=A0A9X0L3R7_SOLP1|nr:hypothetical protein [Solirubrum puertoriconensis]KUG06772.1 hypothetical protein ASU33_05425 [Solirubrum puertoriconensis]